jgi:hypothetical protein
MYTLKKVRILKKNKRINLLMPFSMPGGAGSESVSEHDSLSESDPLS